MDTRLGMSSARSLSEERVRERCSACRRHHFLAFETEYSPLACASVAPLPAPPSAGANLSSDKERLGIGRDGAKKVSATALRTMRANLTPSHSGKGDRVVASRMQETKTQNFESREERCNRTLTRAEGATSPARERVRRIIGGAERDTLTRPSPFILSLKGRG